MSTPKYTRITASIQRQIKRIAVERDKLRELVETAEEIVSNCDEAIDALESAVDSLSQYL